MVECVSVAVGRDPTDGETSCECQGLDNLQHVGFAVAVICLDKKMTVAAFFNFSEGGVNGARLGVPARRELFDLLRWEDASLEVPNGAASAGFCEVDHLKSRLVQVHFSA